MRLLERHPPAAQGEPIAAPEAIIPEARSRERRRRTRIGVVVLLVVAAGLGIGFRLGSGKGARNGRGPGSRPSGVGTANTAPGHIRGSEVLDAVTVSAVSGPVTLSRLGDPTWHRTVHAQAGQFAVSLPAGRYALKGRDGNASCLAVTITVRASRTVRPTVTCTGF